MICIKKNWKYLCAMIIIMLTNEENVYLRIGYIYLWEFNARHILILGVIW